MKEIQATELRDRLEAGETLRVVDIREPDEFDAWHIFGSENVPVYNALKEGRAESLEENARQFDKSQPIVTVCRAGIMSQRAAAVLESLGFDVGSLAGGIRGWGAVWSVAEVPFDGDEVFFIQIRRNGKGCLSYLFGKDGQACVVDPSVDAGVYLELAKQAGLRITQVVETHVHADHLSRARSLAQLTGADLLMQENQRVTYGYVKIHDGSDLTLGGLSVQAIHTPGHTGESTCFLVEDQVLLTGDTLFASAVGRPDLEKGDEGAEAGAHALYASLHRKLLDRFEDIPFYACHTPDPVGFDKQPIGGTIASSRSGQALLGLDEPAFVKQVLDSLQAKPPNHHGIIAVNEGKEDLGPIDPLDVEAGPNRCAAG